MPRGTSGASIPAESSDAGLRWSSAIMSRTSLPAADRRSLPGTRPSSRTGFSACPSFGMDAWDCRGICRGLFERRLGRRMVERMEEMRRLSGGGRQSDSSFRKARAAGTAAWGGLNAGAFKIARLCRRRRPWCGSKTRTGSLQPGRFLFNTCRANTITVGCWPSCTPPYDRPDSPSRGPRSRRRMAARAQFTAGSPQGSGNATLAPLNTNRPAESFSAREGRFHEGNYENRLDLHAGCGAVIMHEAAFHMPNWALPAWAPISTTAMRSIIIDLIRKRRNECGAI